MGEGVEGVSCHSCSVSVPTPLPLPVPPLVGGVEGVEEEGAEPEPIKPANRSQTRTSLEQPLKVTRPFFSQRLKYPRAGAAQQSL